MSLNVDIHKQYTNFCLEVNFTCDEKSIGLLGASGCGKSLTLKCIAGIEIPDKGRIVLNDRILFDSELGINLPVQLRNIGMLFQNYALFPHMTVRKNIEIGMSNKKEKQQLIENLIHLFRLEKLLNKYPSQLSGGEQQRVALARSMSMEPELLMLDEPFYALDAFLKERVQQELFDLLQEYHGKIIMVSHSRDELFLFCDSIVVVNHGHIVERGTKRGIFNQPTIIATAELTGCKNISRAEKISDYMVRAIDWNISLKTGCYVPQDVRYVGIRAHNIRAGTGSETENVIPVSLLKISEGPYEYKLTLLNQSENVESGRLYWTVSKQEWKNVLRERLPEHIFLPWEDILLLKDNT